MSEDPARPACPHCGARLQPFRLPDNSGWDEGIHFACFNDDCPYFRRGWAWMLDHYGVKASYRFRIDPSTGNSTPLPVWSRDAVKDRILDADVVAEPAGDDASGETEETAQSAQRGAQTKTEETARSVQRRARRREGSSALKTDARPPRAARREAARASSSDSKSKAVPPRKGKAR